MRTVLALLVMFALPLFIPVLPVPGLPGLLAGLLGGYLAGAAGRAALLALLPALVLAVVIATAGFGVGLPLLGSAIAGVALIWLAFENVALLFGAVLGGAIATVRGRGPGRADAWTSSGPRVTAVDPADPAPTAPVATPASLGAGAPVARRQGP